MSTSGMSIAEHFDEMRIRLIRIVICIAIITIITMSFGIKTAIIPITVPSQDAGQQQNLTLYYLYPDPFNNIALQLTAFMKDTLLPPEVKLIQTAPGQVFFAQIHISLLIGLICSLPIVIREIFGFISPAFYQPRDNGEFDNRDVRNTNTGGEAAQGNVQQARKEEDGKKSKRSFSKIDLFKIISPMFVLFIFGVVFSYVLVIPLTLDFLYKYGESIGAETLLTVNDFIAFVMQFILAFGIAFQLPVLMYALSLSGLTDSKFWQRNFRYAIIIITVFGAIITPDGTGITMWFIALPMIGLYAVGIIAIRRKERNAITL